MANSKYRDEVLLQNTWIVVRIDGRGFHKLSDTYSFTKPNDRRALDLMNHAAQSVFRSVPDLCIAYGVSDEYSFVIHKSSMMFDRRASKIISTVVSTFTAAYVLLWDEYFGKKSGERAQGGRLGGEIDDAGVKMEMLRDDGGDDDNNERPSRLREDRLPTFDARAVCYPSLGNLRDYLAWRQVDCHINNLYNTTFWALVQKGGHTNIEAENILKGTLASDKNEILFSRFNINYNNEDEIYRKGSVVFREYQLVDTSTKATGTTTSETDVENQRGKEPTTELDDESATATITTTTIAATIPTVTSTSTSVPATISKTQQEKLKKARQKAKIVIRHLDIIKDEFWDRRPWILSGRPGVPLSS